MITNAFTCTGHYAILIMLGIKRVENRSMLPTSSKGRCAISCRKSFTKEEYGEFVRWAARALTEEFETIPAWNEVKDWPGKVVGCCDYTCDGQDARCPSEMWDEGYDYWWNLAEAVCLERPIPCRGNVGVWQMPPALTPQVNAADSFARQIGERIAEPVLVSLGTSSLTTTVSPGEVFRVALTVGAKSIIVAHNHPSGNVTPSAQDRELTVALKRLGEVIGVSVLDHLVVTGDSFVTISNIS